ncbi:alpha/beta hydrolase [Tersicoccus sp. MR15.9]|uniref:alpha/beta fold hydrolase n=1 Tax=Tersicoccus mangrovi TaxID=3121635 RepID=UPI002FE690A9
MTVPRLTAVDFRRPAEQGRTRPLVVLGPSLGTAAQPLWQRTADLLADDLDLIAWDLPGHGTSAPQAEPFTIAELAAGVLELVDRTLPTASEAGPIGYAGVSVGGATGLQLLLDAPDRFRAAAVICSGAKIGDPAAWRERAETVRASGTPVMVTGSAQRWFGPGFLAREAPTATALLSSLQHADRFSYARVCEALAGFDVRDRLAEIAVPVLAVAGAADAVAPVGLAREVADGVADGRAVELPGVAHLAPAEDPVATAALLREHFLGSQGVTGAPSGGDDE